MSFFWNKVYTHHVYDRESAKVRVVLQLEHEIQYCINIAGEYVPMQNAVGDGHHTLGGPFSSVSPPLYFYNESPCFCYTL